MVPNFVHMGLGSKVIFARGSVARLSSELEAAGRRRALLLSTPGQRRKIEAIAQSLGPLCVGAFSDAKMHTPLSVTELAVDIAHNVSADCVVSFGGGSAIGLGKAISFRTDLFHLAIPTTYSGSEMTPIIGETANGEKKTRRNTKILPKTVIYDVDLTLSVPAMVLASSGLNAIAHGLEALYWPECGPIVRFMAAEGIGSLFHSLVQVVATPEDRNSRTAALYGSWLCGSCLGMAPMALHHKLCHVLGGSFDLPHSETHAALLPHTAAYNATVTPDATKILIATIGHEDPALAFYELGKSLGIQRSLQALGMKASDLRRAADLVLENRYENPRPVTRSSILQLLQRAYRGDPPLIEAA
ncbi:maleylacetate reductase [Pseudolabrys sp.]|uniref:maleylacetate reductase n=1 Tax=Pseudolabrys sp. TaxID=1960880 RepID=UPI003D0A8595